MANGKQEQKVLTHPESQFCLEFPFPSACRQNGDYENKRVLPFPLLSWRRAQVSRRKKQRALGGGHTTGHRRVFMQHSLEEMFPHPAPIYDCTT